MTEKTYDYDPADYLDSPEAIEVFLTEAFSTGDSDYIAKAIGVAAKAKGLTEVVEQSGLTREQLYRFFSEQGNPTLKTLLSVMQVLGFRLMPAAS